MAAPAPQKTACLIIIGNELLSGRTQDENLSYVGARLGDLGVALREVRIIADVEDDIVAAVNACRAAFDYVFTTGGIGPTHDDITAGSIAKAFGVALELDAEARARLQAAYGDAELNQARLRMAHIPVGATLIDNPVSSAPGFQIANVFVMAGVPTIMQAMFETIRDRLVGGPALRTRTVSVYLPEGELAGPLAVLQKRYADIAIGSYPFFRARRLGSSIVLRGTDMARLDGAKAELTALMRDLGGEPIEQESGGAAGQPRPRDLAP